MRSVVLHAIELGPVCLDTIEHAVDDPSEALLELFDPARRKCRQQQTPDTSMLLAIHLRDELGKHDLIELLPTRAARHLGLERLGLRKNAVHVSVAANNHLWRAAAEHIERAPSRPFGHVAVRVRLELGAAEIDVDDVAAI